MKESYYFAYGSNMNLDQMAYRCPAASVVEKVKLEGYRLTFCGRGKGWCETGSHGIYHECTL